MFSKRETLGLVLVISIIPSGCSTWRKGLSSDSPLVVQPPPLANPLSNNEQEMSLAICLETAKLAEERGLDQEAIQQYLKARKLDPKIEGVSHSLAVLYDRGGQADAAQREYRLAIEENSSDANLLCDYGYFLYTRGEWDTAEKHLRKALQIDPQHRQAKINLATSCGLRGDYGEAEKLFTEAVGPAAAKHNLGMLRLRRGDRDGAIIELQQAAQRDASLQTTRDVLAHLSRR